MMMARAAWGALALALALVAAVAAAAAVAIWRARAARGSVAFLHPFTNHGGGGERVLWVAVAALMRARPEADVAVYSGDGLTGEQLATRAVERFGVRVPRAPRVVPLQTRALVEDRWYPVATVLGQSLGSMLMTLEALCRLCPDVFIDTAGYAFGYPLAAAAGCSVCAYVHYPTVSSDMIARVRARAGTVHLRRIHYKRNQAQSLNHPQVPDKSVAGFRRTIPQDTSGTCVCDGFRGRLPWVYHAGATCMFA